VTETRVVPPEVTLDLRHRVLRPHQTKEEVRAHGDGRPGIAVFEDDVVVACASVRDEPMPGDPREGDWRLRGMATDPEARGMGYGGVALRAAIDYAYERGARRIWCNARTVALGFYEHHGFTTAGEEFVIAGAGPHYIAFIDLSRSGST
jgi:GNAT superfamily N-acetyltransferase